MTEDRININERGDWTGPDTLLGAVDDLVVHDVAMVHLEAMTNNAAFLALYKQDGTEIRLWLRAKRAPGGTVLEMREEQ